MSKTPQGSSNTAPHRSLLSYFPYWAALFESGMKEINQGQLIVEDPDDFAKILEWIYTGRLELKDDPQVAHNPHEIRGEMILNMALLERLREMAHKYQINALSSFCQNEIKAINMRLCESFRQPLTKPPHGQNDSRFECSSPASPKLFHDVHFRIGDTSYSGNRVLLACQSRYFRELFHQEKDATKGAEANPFVPAAPKVFFPVWLKAIHSRKAPDFEDVVYSKEDLLQLYRISLLEKYADLKKDWCEHYLEEHHSSLRAEEQFGLHFLLINIDDIILTDFARLKIRDIRIFGLLTPDLIVRFMKLIIVHGKELKRMHFSVDGGAAKEWMAFVSQNCPQLQHLILDGSEITDSDIATLVANCPHLQRLSISSCPITDAAIVQLSQHYGQQLIEFQMGEFFPIPANSLISDAGISELAERCPNLQILDLSGSNVTDKGISMLAKGCPHLQVINLSNCRNVTDVGLMTLVTSCQSLKHLNLNGCKQLTGNSIATISCPHLETLNLQGLSQVYDAAIMRNVVLNSVRSI